MNDDEYDFTINPDYLKSIGGETRHAHAAHRDYEKSRLELAPPPRAELPAAADSQEVVARLEQLDDAVYEAVKGSLEALAKLRQLWPALKIDLGDSLLAESREQYMRCALTFWQEQSRGDSMQDATRACDALEVLSILFEPGLI